MNEGDEASFLRAVESRLREVLEAPASSALHAAARHLCLVSRAKRARPRFVHRLGALAGADTAAVVDVAVAAELIHSASLLHDDVVDAGTERRGRPTANAVYGNQVAVLAGDLLITHALAELTNHPRSLTHDGVRTVARMAFAALRELDIRKNPRTSANAWRDIARGKTGALLGFCARSVAALAGNEALTHRLASAAERFGVAFQMADDLADYHAGTGKSAFQDLSEGHPNLPLLLACAHDEQLARHIDAAWSAGRRPERETIERLGARIRSARGTERARAMLDEELCAASRALGPLAEEPRAQAVLCWARELARGDYFVTEESAA